MTEALQTAAALVCRGLVPQPAAPEQLLATPLMGAPPTPVALAATAALFSRPSGSCAATLADAEREARQDAMTWALRALQPPPVEQIAFTGPRHKEEPADVRGVSDVLRSLCLGTPPSADAADNALCWWEDDGVDEGLRLLDRSIMPPEPDVPQLPPVQPARLSASLCTDLVAICGKVIKTALEQAREVAHIFALLAAASELGFAATAALHPSPLPDAWQPSGQVVAAALHAIGQAQKAILDNTQPSRVFTPRLLASARALSVCACAVGTPPLSCYVAALGETAEQLRHAVYASAQALAAAAQAQATTAVEDDLFYDGGTDGGGAAAASTARMGTATQRQPDVATQAATMLLDGPSGTSSALVLGTGPVELCVATMGALGALCPAQAGDALLRLLRDPSEDGLPSTVQDCVLDALCQLRGAPFAVTAAALGALGAALSAAGVHDMERAIWLLRLTDVSARLLGQANSVRACPDDAASGADVEMPDADAGSQRTLYDAYTQLCTRLCGSPEDIARLRNCGLAAGLALADAACSLLCACRGPPECVSDLALELLSDPRYAVRRAVAVRFPEVLCNFAVDEHCMIMSDVHPVLAGLPASLVCKLPHAVATDKAWQETAMLLLGEVATVSPPFESECIFNILHIAVDTPAHVSVALRVLASVATRLGYNNRFGLIEQHLPHIAHRWTSAGHDIDSMLPASDLLAPDPQLVGGSGVIQTYAKYLLPPLVERNDAALVERIAALCSMDVRNLFLRHGSCTLAALMALKANGGVPGANVYNASLFADGSVLMRTFGSKENVANLVSTKGFGVLRELLRMVRPSSARRELVSVDPSLSAEEAQAAVAVLERMMGAGKLASPPEPLWGGDKVLTALLDMHAAMNTAKSPQHRLATLAALKALLKMLEDRQLVRVVSAPCQPLVRPALTVSTAPHEAAGAQHVPIRCAPAAACHQHAAAARERHFHAGLPAERRAAKRRPWPGSSHAGR